MTHTDTGTTGATQGTDLASIAELLRRRGRVRGEPVAITLFRDEVPAPYAGAMVEPCAIVREAMDAGRHVYVDATHHACLAGAWQAGFIDPPEEISSGRYLHTNTDFFTESAAHAVKNGENVLPRGLVAGIGACPLDRIPEGVDFDVLVVVCDPSIAAMVGGVRVAVDGTPPRGAAGTSLCGDLFALPYHDPNVVISTGDVGGRMFNKVKPNEMFVIIPRRWVPDIPAVLGARPDLTGLLDAIKPGYAAERERKRAERAATGGGPRWHPEARALLEAAPEPIREFAGPTMEEYAREHGHDLITVEVIEAQMDSIGMRLEDVMALSADGTPGVTTGTPAATPVSIGAAPGRTTVPERPTPGPGPGEAADPVDADDLGEGRVRAVATERIPAGAERVWEVLVDAASWPQWYPDIRDVVVDGPLAEGTTMRFATGPVKVAAVVQQFEEQRVLCFEGRSTGSTSRYRFTISPDGDDLCTVSLRQVTSGVAARTMRPVLQRIADTSLPEWLAALGRRSTDGTTADSG